MNIAIKKLSSLFFVLGLIISVEGHAQQDLASNDKTALQAEYAATVNTVKNDQAFAIFPASVKKNASILLNADEDGWATFQVKAKCGKVLLEQQMAVTKGFNKIPVFFVSDISKGVYTTILRAEEKVYFAQLVKE